MGEVDRNGRDGSESLSSRCTQGPGRRRSSGLQGRVDGDQPTGRHIALATSMWST
jgi:hypothetical protein